MAQAIYFQKSEAVLDEFRLIEYATAREVQVDKLQRILRDVKEERRVCDDDCILQTFKQFNVVRRVTIDLIRQIHIWQQTFTKPLRPRLFDCDYIVDRIIGYIDFINATKLKRIFNFQFFRGNALLLPYPNPKTYPPVRITAAIGKELNAFAAPNEDDLVYCYQFFINCLPEDVFKNKLASLNEWLIAGWIPRVWIGSASTTAATAASALGQRGSNTMARSTAASTATRQTAGTGNSSVVEAKRVPSSGRSKTLRHSSSASSKIPPNRSNRTMTDSSNGGDRKNTRSNHRDSSSKELNQKDNGGHDNEPKKRTATLSRAAAAEAAVAAAGATVGSNQDKPPSRIKRRNQMNAADASKLRVFTGGEESVSAGSLSGGSSQGTPQSTRNSRNRKSPKRRKNKNHHTRGDSSVSTRDSFGDGSLEDDEAATASAAAANKKLTELDNYYQQLETMFIPRFGRRAVQTMTVGGQHRAASELQQELKALQQHPVKNVFYQHTTKAEAELRERVLNGGTTPADKARQRMLTKMMTTDASLMAKRDRLVSNQESLKVSVNDYATPHRRQRMKSAGKLSATAPAAAMHSSSAGAGDQRSAAAGDGDGDAQSEGSQSAGTNTDGVDADQPSGSNLLSRRASVMSELTAPTPSQSRKNTLTSISNPIMASVASEQQQQRSSGAHRRMSDLTVTFTDENIDALKSPMNKSPLTSHHRHHHHGAAAAAAAVGSDPYTQFGEPVMLNSPLTNSPEQQHKRHFFPAAAASPKKSAAAVPSSGASVGSATTNSVNSSANNSFNSSANNSRSNTPVLQSPSRLAADAPYRRRRGPPPKPSETIKLSTSGMREWFAAEQNIDVSSL